MKIKGETSSTFTFIFYTFNEGGVHDKEKVVSPAACRCGSNRRAGRRETVKSLHRSRWYDFLTVTLLFPVLILGGCH